VLIERKEYFFEQVDADNSIVFNVEEILKETKSNLKRVGDSN
jgi:hypothetical protein